MDDIRQSHVLLPRKTAPDTVPARQLGVLSQPKRKGLRDWQYKRVSDYVDERMDRPVRIDDLAAQANLSTSHFTRAFSIRIGMSPYSFITRRRLERAQILILSSQAQLADIASQCGLSDQAHLNRLFRKFVGTTPARWRRARLGELGHLQS